ncbi:hypothetical protein JOM56_015517 [Amanita muscaria]
MRKRFLNHTVFAKSFHIHITVTLVASNPSMPKDSTKYKWCTCRRHCNGGAQVPDWTYRRHRDYRNADSTSRRNAFSERHGTLEVNLHLKNALTKTRRKKGPKSVVRKTARRGNTSTQTGTVPTETFSSDEDDVNDVPEGQTRLDSGVDSDDLLDKALHSDREEADVPPPPASPARSLMGQYDDEEEHNIGDDEDEEEQEPEPVPPPAPQASDNSLPRATLPILVLMQQVIDAIKTGGLPDDIKEPEMLHSLGNPPKTTPPLDPTTLTSIKIFNVLALGSQQMYDSVREALSEHPTGPFQIHSYYITRQRLEKQTGISEIRTDMCPKACVAYTGPFAQLENCPECGVSRYKTEDELSESVRKKKKQNMKVPRQQFYTIPLGPQLQALWRTPQNAFFMRYRNRRTQEILALTKQN